MLRAINIVHEQAAKRRSEVLAREKPQYIRAVLKEVSERGPLRTSDLSEGGKSLGGWWGWGDGKRALEYLFLSGQVTASERRGSLAIPCPTI